MSSEPIEIHFDKRLNNNMNLIEEANRGPRGEYYIVAVLAILMVFGLLAYGWQHYQFRETGYRIGEASKERVRLEKKRETLRLERQTYRSSDRIVELAGQLGLSAPKPGQVLPASAAEHASPEPELAARQ